MLRIHEIDSLKEEYKKIFNELYIMYKEKINYNEDISLWSMKKYDYKCYPKQILINKYLLDSNL